MLAAAVLDALGVSGYRFGAISVSVALPVCAAGLMWLLTRNAWATAVILLVAVVLAGTLASRAPWSTGRLDSSLDGLKNLDGFEVLSNQHEGHSWCRPKCPTVTRTWHAPDTGPEAAVVAMAIALSNAGLAPPMSEMPRDILTDHLVVNGSKVDAVITAERKKPGDMRVTVVLAAHR